MERCKVCGKPATQHCAQCGMPLCDDHVKHGIQFRTNNPVVNCPSCKSNIDKFSNKLAIILILAFVAITITVIFVLNSIFFFL